MSDSRASANALPPSWILDLEPSIERMPQLALIADLLGELGWQGPAEEIAETLPHFTNSLDLTDLRNCLARLGYRTRYRKVQPAKLAAHEFPALFLPAAPGPWRVLVRAPNGEIGYREAGIFHGLGKEECEAAGTVFSPVASGLSSLGGTSWFAALAMRFKPTLTLVFALSAAINLISIGIPLYIMAVYDKVVSDQSLPTLLPLTALALLLLASDYALRRFRGRLLSDMSGRVDYLLGSSAVQKLLALPIAFIARASVGAQLARLKAFEAIRELFIGPLISVLFDLPFLLLYLLAIGLIGGAIVLVPIIILAGLLFAVAYIVPRISGGSDRMGEAHAEFQAFVLETATHLTAIKSAAAEETWLARTRLASARMSAAQSEAALEESAINALTSFAIGMSSVLIVGIGTIAAIEGVLSVGALIALTALNWRVVTPAAALIASAGRIRTVFRSVTQINRLMAIKSEDEAAPKAIISQRTKSDLAFRRVSFRYSQGADPAVLGASFTARAGEHVAIVGANGSGRSTILKLAAGLYQPQAGSIAYGGIDIRQFGLTEFRRRIGYVPQMPNLFYGTIAQNIEIAHPLANEDQVIGAAIKAGVFDDINSLKDGFETRVTDQSLKSLPFGFAQKIALARALIREPRLLLLDEPGSGLDAESDQRFMKLLKELRGEMTVLLTSHRPSHLRLCDRVIVLNRGVIEFEGEAERALKIFDVLKSKSGEAA